MTLKKLIPLQGTVTHFHDQVRELKRPYIAISEAEHQILQDGPAEFYQLPDGRVATFGTADGGYALMPLSPKAARDILETQH